MPDPPVNNTSSEPRAFYPYRKNPFSVGTLFGEQFDIMIHEVKALFSSPWKTNEMKALVFWRPTSPTASQYVEHMKNIGILSFSKTDLPWHIMKIIDIVESSL